MVNNGVTNTFVQLVYINYYTGVLPRLFVLYVYIIILYLFLTLFDVIHGCAFLPLIRVITIFKWTGMEHISLSLKTP